MTGHTNAPADEQETGQRKAGRTSSQQITIADLTGVGFQDTAIASLAYARLAR